MIANIKVRIEVEPETPTTASAILTAIKDGIRGNMEDDVIIEFESVKAQIVQEIDGTDDEVKQSQF